MTKIIERANELKAKGYTHMASIVKSVYYTSYWHVVSIDDVLKAGKWIPAGYGNFGKNGNARCRAGVSSKNVDWTKTARR